RGIVVGRLFSQVICHRLAHGPDALAHLGDLGLPLLAQFGLGQNGGHHLPTVLGGIGIQTAHNGLQHAAHMLGLGGLGTHYRQGTATLAVIGKVFGKRVGNQKGQLGIVHGAQYVGVLLDPFGKPLIGQIQEGNEAALFKYHNQLLPLGFAEIDASWVMATGVQQYKAVGGQLDDIAKHALKIHLLGFRVVVAVFVDGNAAALENGLVVGPVGGAYPHAAAGIGLVQ